METITINKPQAQTDQSSQIPPPQSSSGAPAQGQTITPGDAFKAGDNANIPPLITNLNSAAASGNSVSVGQLAGDGALAVRLMDSLIPALIVLLFHALGTKFKKSEFQLTEAEIKTIAPFMKAWLDTIIINFDKPHVALMFTVGFIYGAKIIEKGGVDFLDKLAEKKMNEPTKKPAEQAKAAIDDLKRADGLKKWRLSLETEFKKKLTAAQNWLPSVEEIDIFMHDNKGKGYSRKKATGAIVAKRVKDVKLWYEQQRPPVELQAAA